MGPQEEAVPMTPSCVEDCKEGSHGYGCPHDGDPIVEAANLEAPTKRVEPPKPTRKEIGEWRARNFTVRHATVIACDHKLDLRHFPSKPNCFDCWYAFLESNPEGVASVHDLLQKQGIKAVEAMHGRKFTKMFGRYLQQKLLALREPLSTETEPSLEVIDVAAEKEASIGIR